MCSTTFSRVLSPSLTPLCLFSLPFIPWVQLIRDEGNTNTIFTCQDPVIKKGNFFYTKKKISGMRNIPLQFMPHLRIILLGVEKITRIHLSKNERRVRRHMNKEKATQGSSQELSHENCAPQCDCRQLLSYPNCYIKFENILNDINTSIVCSDWLILIGLPSTYLCSWLCDTIKSHM